MTRLERASGWRQMRYHLLFAALSLFLWQAGHAQGAVYRCGLNQYQAQPCQQPGQISTLLDVADARTEAQLNEAVATQARLNGALPVGKRSKSKATGKRNGASQRSQTRSAVVISKRSKPMALSSHRHGMAPFQDGRLLSDAKAPAGKKQQKPIKPGPEVFTVRTGAAANAEKVALDR